MNHIRTGLLLAALLMAVAPVAVAATTWYVDGVNGNDSNNCKSPTAACGTIGHAISLAASGDTVMVAAATYQEHLNIGISLNVLGAGASTTIIDGGYSGGTAVVFVSNAAAYVTLSGLTIQNGSGGGIYNDGILTINNSTVTANRVASPSCVGGGIYNNNKLTVNNSTITGNKASSALACQGGGIYNGGGAVTINNSTITGNHVGGGRRSIAPGAAGGGIYNSAGTLMINNSTVSSNDATSYACGLHGCTPGLGAGGGIYNAGTLIISNDTFSGNSAKTTGGGIVNHSGSTAALKNSIVANNPRGGNCAGTMTSKGYNMSDDGTCNFSNSGDRNNTNPMLGLLQNNGGPTQTMALPSRSPAIDAGNPSGCTDGNGKLLTTDQRGMPRPDSEDKKGCDMGAYESPSD